MILMGLMGTTYHHPSWDLSVFEVPTKFNQVWGWCHFPLLPCGMDPLALCGAHNRSSRGPHFLLLGWRGAEETHSHTLAWWHPHMLMECHITCELLGWHVDLPVRILVQKKKSLEDHLWWDLYTTHWSTGGGDGLPGPMPGMGATSRTSKAFANREKDLGGTGRWGVLCPQQGQCCCQCSCSPSSHETFGNNSKVQTTPPWWPEGRNPHGVWKMWSGTCWKNHLPEQCRNQTACWSGEETGSKEGSHEGVGLCWLCPSKYLFYVVQMYGGALRISTYVEQLFLQFLPIWFPKRKSKVGPAKNPMQPCPCKDIAFHELLLILDPTLKDGGTLAMGL